MTPYSDYISNHKDRYIDELSALLKFPSVSAQSHRQQDLLDCADHLKDHLQKIGLEKVQLIPTEGYPVVYGEWCHAPKQPTVLVYGHYDVQPEDPIDLWDHPPFEAVLKDGQIIARGASDNKGQFFCHLKAIELLLSQTGKLPCNVKVMIEGEEEIGSPNLPPFINAHKELLACDIALVSDTPMFAKDQPSVCIGLRGLSYIEVTARTASTDLHSGQHGGVAPNAVNELISLLSQLKDPQTGRILIPNFYDQVETLSEEVDSILKTLPFDTEVYQQNIGATGVIGEIDFSPHHRFWFRPTLDVNGFSGGYTGEGAKTVIPCEASAKVSMRLVSNQRSEDICELFISYLNTIKPPYLSLSFKKYTAAEPVMVRTDSVYMSAARSALESAFGVPAILQGEGGSIPVISTFQDALGVETILMGLNLPEDRIHAPNEQFSVSNLLRGIAASASFLENLMPQ